MKTVNIVIDSTDLQVLKDSNYRLCFAKKVNGIFNVVWQSYTEYFANNSFEWTPKFELFGTNTFAANVQVTVSTNAVAIELGQTATLNGAGILGPAKTGGPATGITLDNQYGEIHPGVNQVSSGLDGSEISTPIYVAPVAIVEGQDLLTPADIVQVWFEQDIETSTMFSDARSKTVVIDLTKTDTQTRLYQKGKWSTPEAGELGGLLAEPRFALRPTAPAVLAGR